MFPEKFEKANSKVGLGRSISYSNKKKKKVGEY